MRSHGAGRPGAAISTHLDGIPRFAGVWTHPLMDTVDIDMAERIDIYKSPQAVTYGNMSFGAVNLVPKRVVALGFEARAVGAYGMFDTGILRAEQGGKVDAFDYYFIGSHRQSNGHRFNADGEVDGLFGRTGYEIDKEKHWYGSVLGTTRTPTSAIRGSGAPRTPRSGSPSRRTTSFTS
jgi:outer membrane receptor protein involved in Fe transport